MMPQVIRLLALFALILAIVTNTTLAQDARLAPATVDGERVRLDMRVYAPARATPSPTLVFNHGSTGRGTNPQSFTRPIDFPEVAQFFVARGWAVVIPARRGRGGSEGQYDEGFASNRAAGYACDPVLSVAGAERGLRDVQAAMNAILAMPFVDRTRVVIGGQERQPLSARGRHQPVAFRPRRALSRRHALAVWRRGHVLPPVGQPREHRRISGGRRPRHVPRAAAGARRPLHLETDRSMGAARGELPEAAGLAECRELRTTRQPMTRPPITRIESPVT